MEFMSEFELLPPEISVIIHALNRAADDEYYPNGDLAKELAEKFRELYNWNLKSHLFVRAESKQ